MAVRRKTTAVGVLLYIAALTSCVLLVQANTDTPTVKIGKTNFQGTIGHAEGSKTPAYVFQGIYYAAAPTGKYRFAPPVMRRYAAGEYDATKFGPLCPQDVEFASKAFQTPLPVTDTSEDCLSLNVYTPSLDAKRKLTVMVWFHSGGYNIAGGSTLDGTSFAAYQGVVVVTVNYRLGALGFLSTGDKQAQGNWGLLDQSMALAWVQDNINKFGGNPEQVTIFGVSAGGMSVALHMLSPVSIGLFKRSIAMSGVAISPVALIRKPRKWANALGEALHCSTDQTRKLVDCLREKSVDEIVFADIDRQGDPGLMFAPVVDNHFLNKDPFFLLTSGRFSTNDFMVGFNKDGMSYLTMQARGPPGLMDDFNMEKFRPATMLMLQTIAPGDTNDIADAVQGLYNTHNRTSPLYKFLEAAGDSLYVAPAVATVDAHCGARARTYMFEFRHRSSFSPAPSWVGAEHGEEEYYLGMAFLGEDVRGKFEFTSEEKRFTHVMMSYWANFAKFGDPNGKPGRNSTMVDIGGRLPYWPRYFPREKLYLKLESTPSVGKNIKPDKMGFWNRLFSAASETQKRHQEL